MAVDCRAAGQDDLWGFLMMRSRAGFPEPEFCRVSEEAVKDGLLEVPAALEFVSFAMSIWERCQYTAEKI